MINLGTGVPRNSYKKSKTSNNEENHAIKTEFKAKKSSSDTTTSSLASITSKNSETELKRPDIKFSFS